MNSVFVEFEVPAAKIRKPAVSRLMWRAIDTLVVTLIFAVFG